MHKLLGQICAKGQPDAFCAIINQEGAAYRPLGAFMAVYEDGSHLGNLSSGCIESDIIGHCANLSKPRVLNYGADSSFIDLRMPCGGSMKVLLIPRPPMDIFNEVLKKLDNRVAQAFSIEIETGALKLSTANSTTSNDHYVEIFIEPALNFYIFGNGCEARVFASLVDGAGYSASLYLTDEDRTPETNLVNGEVIHLKSLAIPEIDKIDRYSSITLFFHEHEMETNILLDALKSKAFYIGAQGSQRSHANRIETLKTAGVTEKNTKRIRGPIGLIPRVRDPQTLAISVLAEIHEVALQAEE